MLEGVGRRISSFLQGYAGISAIVSYVTIVVNTLNQEVGGSVASQFFAYGGPILAMLGYFAFWGATAVIYERVTLLNNPKLLKKYGLATYEAVLTQVPEQGQKIARAN